MLLVRTNGHLVTASCSRDTVPARTLMNVSDTSRENLLWG